MTRTRKVNLGEAIRVVRKREVAENRRARGRRYHHMYRDKENERRRSYYRKHKEMIREKNRAYYLQNKDRICKKHRVCTSILRAARAQARAVA